MNKDKAADFDIDDEVDQDDIDDLSMIDDLFPGDEKPLEEPQADALKETPTVEDGEEEEGAGDKTPSPQDAKPKETPAEEPVKEEAKKEEVKEQPTPPEQPQSNTPTAEEQAEYQQRLEAFDKEARTYLAEKVYALTEEEAEELETDPVAALPKLAASMHLQVMRAATNNVARLLPQMIESIQNSNTTAKGFEDKFFEAHPKLAEHKETVMRYGQVYRQMNPKASPEDFIRDVGAQVAVGLGIAQQQQAPAAPAQPQTPPFQPAAAGQGGGAVTMAPTNEFEAMALELLEEDD